ncbi:MAG: DNA repair protein RadA [Gemmatimonadetes bacterium]|nr:DNA repair protein RadA [Gemmatimonadota bacterium]
MKQKIVFACQECGAQSSKWMGRCGDCGAWNSIVEERPVPEAVMAGAIEKRYSLAVAAGPQLYADISILNAQRLSTGIGEFDRVLGGGVVPGSLVLIGGEPGIGKSTLLLQAAAHFAREFGPVLYSSGEESEHQIKARGERLGIERAPLYILAETCLERILEEIARLKPSFIIVDSIQTVFSLKFQSAPGSIGQVREAATQLLFAAKGQNIPTFLVGHVTKDGSIAGPRVLEHMVDTVLQFEGDRYHTFRVLRSLKNRFGSTNEVGVFEMTGAGMVEVEDPSAFFLSRREGGTPPGVVTVCLLEGTRPMLVEIESLVAPSPLAIPRRVTNGIEVGRVNMLCAVLSRRAGLVLGDQDVYVNVTGGVRVEEPAADLGVALAIASALRDRPVEAGVACFGEVGLTGDVRFVSGAPRRVAELLKLGFKRIISPEGVPEGPRGAISGAANGARNGRAGREVGLVEVKTLEEAVGAALS